MKIDVLTLFPGMFDNFLQTSIVGRAIEQNAIEIKITNIRDFAEDKHHNSGDLLYSAGKTTQTTDCKQIQSNRANYYIVRSLQRD